MSLSHPQKLLQANFCLLAPSQMLIALEEKLGVQMPAPHLLLQLLGAILL